MILGVSVSTFTSVHVVLSLVGILAGAVVQAFQKLPFLRPLAPTRSEPPFLVTQLLVLAIFVALGLVAAKRFHPEMSVPA